MRYLIDGYNLLHALLGPPASSRHGLEAARQRLLDRLHELPQIVPARLTVVFDAQRTPGGIPTELYYRGIYLQFSKGRTADDLIEDLIRADLQPHTLTVVSDDHRLQAAARRRPCAYFDCLDWVDRMKQPKAARVAQRAEKPEAVGNTEEWLETFAGLDLKDLDDPDVFLRET